MNTTVKDQYLPQLLISLRDEEGIAILRGDPSVIQRDLLFICLRDLVVTRNPDKKLSDSEIVKLVADHISSLNHYHSVLVYYPWNKTLVQLPSKEDFIELRTNRNKYKISPEEGGRLAKARIGIVGLSVGNAVAMAIALERACGELRIADFDTIELSNLNRIQAGVHTIGMSKTVLVARQIAEIDPFIEVSCFTDGVTEKNIAQFFSKDGNFLDLVIDECDSLDIKVLLRKEARRLGIPVLMATSDRGMLDVERFDMEPDRRILHGLVDGIKTQALAGLSTEEKIPYVLKILEVDGMSSRGKASLLEIGNSIKTWPQLASGVMLGGAQVADVSRRILLGENIPSGRYFVDFETLISASSPTRKFSPLKDTEGKDANDTLQPTVQPREKRTVSSMASQVEYGRLFLGSLHSSVNALPLEEDTVRALVADAIMAPSGGNVQPWIWLYKSPVLLLMLDKKRSESILDFNRTASIAALGAATENVVLSAHHRGLEVNIQLFDKLPDNMIFTAFEFFKAGDILDSFTQSHTHDSLYGSVSSRKTNRRMGARQTLSHKTIHDIQQAVKSVHGATLSIISSDSELEALGEMLGASDRMRMLNLHLHEEMMKEMRFTEEDALATRDGISVSDLDLGILDRTGLFLCRDWRTLSFMKRWGAAGALSKFSQKAIQAASAAVLLTMPTRVDYSMHASFFYGGQAMQKVWLTATSLGVAFQPMSALPYLFARCRSSENETILSAEEKKELAALRPQFEKLFHIDANAERSEVLLFRLAVTDAPAYKSLRRPIDEVLFF